MPDVTPFKTRIRDFQNRLSGHLLAVLEEQPYPEAGLFDGTFAEVLTVARAAGVDFQDISDDLSTGDDLSFTTFALNRWIKNRTIPTADKQTKVVDWLKQHLRPLA